jgi:hypothetical protein
VEEHGKDFLNFLSVLVVLFFKMKHMGIKDKIHHLWTATLQNVLKGSRRLSDLETLRGPKSITETLWEKLLA